MHKHLASTILVAYLLGVFTAPLVSARQEGSWNTELTIVWHDRHMTIGGNVSSSANDAKLRQIASKNFPHSSQNISTKISTLAPPGWSLITELTLRAMAKTRSATALITPGGVHIQGLTDDVEAWSKESQRLHDNLLAGMRVVFTVSAIAPEQRAPVQCRSLFERTRASRSIGFAHGSNLLSTATYPLLDELVQIAADCPESSLHITGHTDSSGDESLNLALSEARAKAVVDYMVGRGIANERLQASGAGSGAPLGNESDSGARSRNRRIEIELIQ